ncbi:MAG: DUF2085 domain-containing protein [Methanococcaceae archaeon]
MNILFRISFFVLLLLWCAGIFAEFILPYSGKAGILFPFINVLYSDVCHQQQFKRICLGNSYLLVCSRCTGIYLGLLISSFLSLFIQNFKKPLYLLFLSALPMLLDVCLYTMGFYTYSQILALFTGVLLGSVGFFYILDGFENFIYEWKTKRIKN